MRSMPAPSPYRSSPVFDERTLPAALRREHRTKPGVWGVIRVFEGTLKLTLVETGEVLTLSPGSSGIVQPDQLHHVAVEEPMRMQVDFYDKQPHRDHLEGGLRG